MDVQAAGIGGCEAVYKPLHLQSINLHPDSTAVNHQGLTLAAPHRANTLHAGDALQTEIRMRTIAHHVWVVPWCLAYTLHTGPGLQSAHWLLHTYPLHTAA